MDPLGTLTSKQYSHIVKRAMKTMIELLVEPLTEAKMVAAKHRTTMKAMIEHALRREIAGSTPGTEVIALLKPERTTPDTHHRLRC